MSFQPKILLRFTIVSIAMFAIQLMAIGSSFALDPIVPQGTSGDLSITIFPAAQERAFAVGVCNNGVDDISSFTLDIDTINFTVDDAVSLPGGFAGSNVDDSGSYNSNTSVWSGTLMGSDSAAINSDPTPQCVSIGFVGTVTGSIGQTIGFTASIVSSVLGDSSPNVDPTSGNNTDSYTTAPIVLDPDLIIETRLLTTGVIENNTPVSYEVTIKNVGDGQYVESIGNPLGVYFIVPAGATFDEVVDENLADNLAITTCGTQGNVNGFLPAFAGYDAELAGCQLVATSGFIPAGAEYKLRFDMVANGPFSAGDTEVLGIVVADDADSILLQVRIFTPSTDPFEIENNNYVELGFDNTALQATVNRCTGIGEVVTSNSACFTISFNKEIYAPSFDEADIAVTNGEVDTLTQVGDNLWEIRVKNLVSGKTVSITLSPTNDILDYSAVIADTQVLGINTVRYEDGTLPATGSKLDSDVWAFAFSIMLLGLLLLRLSKQKNFLNS